MYGLFQYLDTYGLFKYLEIYGLFKYIAILRIELIGFSCFSFCPLMFLNLPFQKLL